MISYFALQAEAAFKQRVENLNVFSSTTQTEACRQITETTRRQRRQSKLKLNYIVTLTKIGRAHV